MDDVRCFKKLVDGFDAFGWAVVFFAKEDDASASAVDISVLVDGLQIDDESVQRLFCTINAFNFCFGMYTVQERKQGGVRTDCIFCFFKSFVELQILGRKNHKVNDRDFVRRDKVEVCLFPIDDDFACLIARFAFGVHHTIKLVPKNAQELLCHNGSDRPETHNCNCFDLIHSMKYIKILEYFLMKNIMEYYSKEIPGQAGNDRFEAHAKHMAGMRKNDRF